DGISASGRPLTLIAASLRRGPCESSLSTAEARWLAPSRLWRHHENPLRRAPGPLVERPLVGPGYHARSRGAQPERTRDDGPSRARPGDNHVAGDAPQFGRGLPGDFAGPGQAAGAAVRWAESFEPRLCQPGDRLGHGARAIGLLRAARAPGTA